MSSDEDEYELDCAMQAHGSCYSCYYWDEKHARFRRRGVGQYKGGDYKEYHNKMTEVMR